MIHVTDLEIHKHSFFQKKPLVRKCIIATSRITLLKKSEEVNSSLTETFTILVELQNVLNTRKCLSTQLR